MSSSRFKNAMAIFALIAAFSFSLPASPAWAKPLASQVDYIITTFAGTGIPAYSGDGGPATQAQMFPGIVIAAPDGSVYISTQHAIRRVARDGIINTIAGSSTAGFSGDGGPATQALFSFPGGMALAPDGTLYIADVHNQRIRRIDLNGIITTVAGTGIAGFSGDGGPATQARFSNPQDIALGPDGSLYISDLFNQRIRRVGQNGIITTVAGTGVAGYNGDGGLATRARLYFPGEVEVGPDGGLYIADQYNQRIRRVGVNGIITTVAGNGVQGFSGDGGPATHAQLNIPGGLAIGVDGSLYITDHDNERVRRVGPDSIITTIAGNGTQGFSGDGGPGPQAQLHFPISASVDAGGNVYFVDSANYRVRRLTPGAPQTLIFADGFESGNFSQWSNYSSDHGDLSVSAAAALVGAQGLQANINDNTPIGMRDEKSLHETHYRARFYFDPNSLAMANNDWHVLFFGYSDSGTATPVLRVDLLINGSYAVRPSFLDDGVTWRQSGRIPISNGVHYLELEWQAATAPSANDGFLNFWVDGVQRSQITGMDNDTRRIERVRLGAIAGIDPNTRGADFFDAFESRRSDYIGADPNGPVVVALSANAGDITAWTETSELTDPEEAELIREVRQEASPHLYLPSLVR